MLKKTGFLISITALITLVFCFISCNRNNGGTSSFEIETLFTLNYGNFEDEINLFDLSSAGSSIDTHIAMRDGFFYIANGESKKIMEMNSYGDLLKIYYNDEYNPSPSFLDEDDGVTSTRKAIAYPFNKISSICVDYRKNLYVADKLPPERYEVSENGRQQLSEVILWFDSDGNYIDYIGQNGIGGTPFPYIKNIYATINNELVVVCLSSDGFVVYWFSEAGHLLYTIPVENRYVPNPFATESSSSDYWLNVENIVPDYSEKKLYVNVDYYSSYIDEASRIQSGIDYSQTLLYTLDIADASFESPITVPSYRELITKGFSTETYNIPYDFIGMSENGWFFFMVSTEEGFNVEMIQNDTQRVLSRKLPLENQDNLYYTFTLSNNGILSMLLVRNDRASVNWWRTDELIQSVIKN